MKTALWFTILMIGFSFCSLSQEMNKKITDEKLDREVLIGYCDRAGLHGGEFGEHFMEEYDGYAPKEKYLKKIMNKDVDYSIVLVLATWCHDSKMQVPRFYKLMDKAGLDAAKMKIICVDGNKTGGDVSIDAYGIVRVPTLIYYRDGKEIGRIIESPEKSLERDMWKIIK